MKRLEVFITVKTYPIPSASYDELVCTAGVTKDGEFVRLYPINYRELPWNQQFQKYQWIEVEAEKHKGRDPRKESWRPNCDTLRFIGEQIPTQRGGNWDDRAKYVLPLASQSMEELYEKKQNDKTSLGFFKPKEVFDLIITPEKSTWSAPQLAALKQARLWETRKNTQVPPRKVPWKFQYQFCCDDPRCNAKHQMMIEDWEVGALYWREVDRGKSPEEAAKSVKRKFLEEICGQNKDTYFYVGTILKHGSWVIIGIFYPKKKKETKLPLFDRK
jgi:hypothetical protein